MKLAAGVGLAAVLGAAPAQALSHDKDSSSKACVVTLGGSTIEIAGYHPDAPRDKYCDEFPTDGPLMLTFDLVDDALRAVPIELRILREDGATEAALPPRLYASGIISVGHDFRTAGRYVVELSSPGEGGARQVARFPFRVGKTAWSYLPQGLGAVLIAGLLGVWWRHGGQVTRRPQAAACVASDDPALRSRENAPAHSNESRVFSKARGTKNSDSP